MYSFGSMENGVSPLQLTSNTDTKKKNKQMKHYFFLNRIHTYTLQNTI